MRTPVKLILSDDLRRAQVMALLGHVITAQEPNPCVNLIYDAPRGFALEALFRMRSSAERARTVVVTDNPSPVYKAVLEARYPGGVTTLVAEEAGPTIAFVASGGRMDYRTGLMTQRARETVMLLLIGFSREEAAECMGVSVKTINAHISNVLQAFGLRSFSELMRTMLYPEQVEARELRVAVAGAPATLTAGLEAPPA